MVLVVKVEDVVRFGASVRSGGCLLEENITGGALSGGGCVSVSVG